MESRNHHEKISRSCSSRAAACPHPPTAQRNTRETGHAGQAGVGTSPGKLDTQGGGCLRWFPSHALAVGHTGFPGPGSGHGREAGSGAQARHGSSELQSQVLPNHHHRPSADVATNSFVSEAAIAAGLVGADGRIPLGQPRERAIPAEAGLQAGFLPCRPSAEPAGTSPLLPWQLWVSSRPRSSSLPSPLLHGQAVDFPLLPPRRAPPPPLSCAREAGLGFVDRKCFLYLSLSSGSLQPSGVAASSRCQRRC